MSSGENAVSARSPETGGASDLTVDDRLAGLAGRLDETVAELAAARPFGKHLRRSAVMDIARRILRISGGVDIVYQRIRTLEAAGVFDGTDWASPEILQAPISAQTLRLGDTPTALLEVLSEIRFLAVSRGEYLHPSLSAEQAQHFLVQVTGLNLDILFGLQGEAARMRPAGLNEIVSNLLAYVVNHVGRGEIVDGLIVEIWRLLAQRPIVVEEIKTMITQISVWLSGNLGEHTGAAGWGADRLISAVFGPTSGCREDPGFVVYGERLNAMDAVALSNEAAAFARAMHDTGLVSVYHAVFLRHVLDTRPELIAQTLGLSSTGADAYRCYGDLVGTLIERAVHPETAQAIYGLSLMLERGVLYMPPVAPALWRQIGLKLSRASCERLTNSFGSAVTPADTLLAGVLSMLGQPLGVGQGNNPTCQSARALSMWAYTDPDFLLQVVSWCARDENLTMHFEGQAISSRDLAAGLAAVPPGDVDPVSTVVVPHLDRIYAEMGRLCVDRDGDAHRWVNPELHGWWVGRGCEIAVDVATGKLADFDNFVRSFYTTYHPFHNGNQPVIHLQPAGIAVTDSGARYVGWHAIAICRVALDQEGAMRVYFFNPNNDSGQDWGNGVIVSTEGHGERFGEASLPITEFVSRLYLFHHDPLEKGPPDSVPAEEVLHVETLARGSWAIDR